MVYASSIYFISCWWLLLCNVHDGHNETGVLWQWAGVFMCACCGINQMHITELTLSLVNGFARCFGYSTQLFAISVPLTYDPLSHLISSHLMRWHFYIHYSGTQKITTMKTAKHNKVTNTNGHTTIWILIFFHFFLFQLFSWNFCLLSIFVVILVVATTFAILIKKKKRLLDEISAFYSFFFHSF